MGRQSWVVGNWKMHGGLAANAKLLGDISGCGKEKVRVGVCAPFPYLQQVAQELVDTGLAWGSQDVSEHESGAYTGEVSAPMLREFSASIALVGHSERRAYHGETSELVARKARTAMRCGIVPIACLGETLAQREAGQAFEVIGQQLGALLEFAAELDGMVLAYEPVWAIGTGKTASPEQAQEIHGFIRRLLVGAGLERTPVLYGGSVKAANAASIFAMPDIDGGLIGGASLVAEDFLAIVAASDAAVGA